MSELARSLLENCADCQACIACAESCAEILVLHDDEGLHLSASTMNFHAFTIATCPRCPRCAAIAKAYLQSTKERTAQDGNEQAC